MSRPARTRAIAVALAVAGAALAAGCGSAAAPPPAPAAQTTLSVLSLDTSLVTPAGTWAVAVMGGSAAQYNDFWQLFLRPAGSTRWQLVTPPGTADNGGLVLAGSDGQPLVTGFRPSQKLTFSPLIETRDGGRAWSSLSPLGAALASTPDALAIKPGSGSLLALLAGGTAELAAPGYTMWTTLASQQTLAATSPGRRCGLQNLTAATFTPSGIPMLAGTCARPGTAGIFTSQGGTWQAAGPAIPAALARQDVTVLRLTRTAQGIAALLQAGTGPAASMLAAWSADGGGHWTSSPPLTLNGTALTSASFGPGSTAAIIMTGNRGDIISSAGSPWRPLPPLPPGTTTLAPGPGGAADALAVNRGTLTIWQLAPGGATWTRAQAIHVLIPYGSSS
jgi:hypothetical protein